MFPKAQWLRQKLWHQTVPGSVMALLPTDCVTWINLFNFFLSLISSSVKLSDNSCYLIGLKWWSDETIHIKYLATCHCRHSIHFSYNYYIILRSSDNSLSLFPQSFLFSLKYNFLFPHQSVTENTFLTENSQSSHSGINIVVHNVIIFILSQMLFITQIGWNCH